MRTSRFTALALAALAPALAYAADDAASLREDAAALFETIPAKPDPAPDAAKVELGKMLFFEPRLSESHSISCNSCHNIGTGGADLRPKSLGHKWQEGGRNSPTVYNALFNTAQFWDGRAEDLKAQAAGPMENPVEMATSREHVVEMINGIPGYAPLFRKAFPDSDQEIAFDHVLEALAAFERTLVTPGSPFDRFLEGDDTAMTDQQKRGMRQFMDAGCASCHSGRNLGGNSYQPFGVVEKPGESVLPPDDPGRFEVTRSDNDKYVFKVPTLRNVALTPPYFHSGSVWSLKHAVEIMAKSQLGEDLEQSEINDITAFLHALTGEQPEIVYPILPQSTAETPRPPK